MNLKIMASENSLFSGTLNNNCEPAQQHHTCQSRQCQSECETSGRVTELQGSRPCGNEHAPEGMIGPEDRDGLAIQGCMPPFVPEIREHDHTGRLHLHGNG